MNMPVTTIDGYRITEYLGVARGIIVRANAIVGMCYDASEVVSKTSATEVLCYGTAVVIQREPAE